MLGCKNLNIYFVINTIFNKTMPSILTGKYKS